MNYLDPNYNPLTEAVETDFQNRIDQYVRDFIWGVRNNKWSSYPMAIIGKGGAIIEYEPSFTSDIERTQFKQKWRRTDRPTASELWTWGYISERGALTREVFQLLYTPSTAPNVFISYRHKACSSSTLALVIEARLKLFGNNNTFIDKTMNAGDDLKERIDNGLNKCDVFVLLMDKEIFKSDWTIYEYQTAVSLGKKVITIVHPDVTNDDLHIIIKKGKKILDIKHADVRQDELDKIVAQGFDMGKLFIKCADFGAIKYENAINELLNVLGYATY